MDEQKKQKTMIVVLAVVALGAGGYWYAARDSGNSNAQYASQGPAERKTRDAPVKRADKNTKKTGRRESAATVAEGRKERRQAEDRSEDRRNRKKDRGKRVKKETLKPAA